MFGRKYKYFVSYTVGTLNGNGVGNSEITLDNRIKGIKDTMSIEKMLLEDLRNTQIKEIEFIKISNYILIK